jgi:ribonuclease E
VIIEPTEALTVIDVNSGSFTRSANARETVLWTNCEAATEIARQLRLRNIGGVVVVDFIDMDSRRDQLQLLEHFTQAVRHDGARPQIAQLTELGLVELTRKRQGQNIYELFGRACPSCGGLGHVAVLPGKDTLQPLATAGGLVRSAASARAEVASPGGAEAVASAGGRRRRGGRGGRGSDTQELLVETPLLGAPSAEAETAPTSEPPPRREESAELVAVPMQPEQELVFGWMGLNPTLLLDSPPSAENLVVRVVRPGEDAEEILEQARQQLAAQGSRRRRRGRGGGDSRPAAGGAAVVAEQIQPRTDSAPLPVVLPDELAEPAPMVVPIIPRTVVTAATLPPPAPAPEPEPVSAPQAGAPEADDEAGEPRRRRRRSSASA